jgi:hypothetical protein
LIISFQNQFNYLYFFCLNIHNYSILRKFMNFNWEFYNLCYLHFTIFIFYKKWILNEKN